MDWCVASKLDKTIQLLFHIVQQLPNGWGGRNPWLVVVVDWATMCGVVGGGEMRVHGSCWLLCIL